MTIKASSIIPDAFYCVKLCNLRLILRRNRNFAILLFQLGKYFFIVGKIKTYYFPRITFQPFSSLSFTTFVSFKFCFRTT